MKKRNPRKSELSAVTGALLGGAIGSGLGNVLGTFFPPTRIKIVIESANLRDAVSLELRGLTIEVKPKTDAKGAKPVDADIANDKVQ